MKSGSESARSRRYGAILLAAGGLLAVIVAWHAVSLYQMEFVFPGPGQTAAALWEIRRTLGAAIVLTLQRALLGFTLAVAVGFTWGWMMGTWRYFADFCSGILQIMLAIPPIVIVVLGMVWFGTNSLVVVFVVCIVGMPVLAINTRDAVRNIDVSLLEMAQVFDLGRRATFNSIILPSVLPPVLSSITVVLAQSLRLTIMGELLATSTGIGAEIRLAQINIETAEVFAYALVMASLSYLLEALVLRPVRRRFTPPRAAL